MEEKEKAKEPKAKEKEQEKKVVGEVEEAEIDAYMECAQSEEPSEKDRMDYLKRRLEEVRSEYKQLQLVKSEAEGRKDDKILANVTASFRINYKARRFVVTELRRMGEEVEDRFVPKSAT